MTTRNPFMDSVPEDPIPWLTERFREAGCFSTTEPVEMLSLFQGAIQSTVNAMSDNSKPYAVKYSAEHGSAYTDGKSHLVVIGTKPLLDPTLTDGQRAALLLAVTGHEVGHVRWSVSMQDRLEKHYAGNPHKSAWAAQVFNILHDIHLEHWQQVDFPPMVPALAMKARYFSAPWTLDLSRPQTRYGALIQATLYPHATDWSSPEGREFKAWADSWAERARGKAARRFKDALALIEEALTRLRYDETPEPPPEDGPKPTGEPGEDEPEDGEDEDGEGTGTDGEDDESEPEGDGSSAPPDKSDEDGEPEDGTSEGGDSGEEDDEWRDPDEGSGAPPEKGDGETVEPGDEATEEGEGGEPIDSDDPVEFKPEDDAPPVPEREPSLHGEMHSTEDEDWQAAIDTKRRTQAAGRDRFVMGDGETFKYREVRISRIQK